MGPFSPPVAATHDAGLHVFQVGQLASDELAAIAQDGNEVPMADLLLAAAGVLVYLPVPSRDHAPLPRFLVIPTTRSVSLAPETFT